MILHSLGVEMLARLMSLDRPGDDDSWLLFGPTDPQVVAEPTAEVPEESLRWAAE